MRKKLLELLACPRCRSGLRLDIFEEGDQVESGLLTCSCGEWFPVIKGVPRILIGDMRGDYSGFISGFRKHFPEGVLKKSHAGKGRTRLKKRTSNSFGLEWKKYSRYGWLGRGKGEKLDISDYRSAHLEHTWAHTVETFWRKTLLEPGEVRGKLVLDVGVGNGRYAQACTDAGAEVVGIDLSEAVDVAYANTKGKVNTVQCDIFNLPFKEGCFDVIYSIGVLHHTPDTKAAFESVQKLVKKNGIVSIHLYHKGNPIYEFNDRLIRLVTTRLSLGLLWYLCYVPAFLGRMASVSRFLYAGANSLVVIRSDHHFNFDWYSAPVAYHHTETEVAGWFRGLGFRKIRGDDPCRYAGSYFAKIYPGFTKNADGTVKRWAAGLVPRWALTVRGIR